MLDKNGAIGSQFTGIQSSLPPPCPLDTYILTLPPAQGNIGKIGEAVGGPFSSQGMIGKNFNPDGAIGGAAQGLANKNQEH